MLASMLSRRSFLNRVGAAAGRSVYFERVLTFNLVVEAFLTSAKA